MFGRRPGADLIHNVVMVSIALRRTAGSAETVRAHRQWWDAEAEDYYAEHGAFLGDADFCWGPEGLRESEAGLLGSLAGKDVLEIGAGSAQCSRWVQAQGARVQRPLWASTGTKNPAYSDVVYVDELIGPDTVNTVPPQTLAALLDHGQAALALETQLDQARQTLADLEELGISMVEVTDQLEHEGVASFADAFASLLAGVEMRRGVAA